MANRTTALNDRLYDYLIEVSVREPPLLRELREETAALPMAMMQIGPEQGQFMRLLIELIGARRAVEVGTFTGYSALCVAEAMGPQGRLVACDVSEEYTAVARRYWARGGVAELHQDLVTLTVIDDRDRGGIDGHAVEFGRPHAAASMLRVDDRDVIAGAARPPPDRKCRPHGGNTRSDAERRAGPAQSKQSFDSRLIHPPGRTRVPGPPATTEMHRMCVDVRRNRVRLRSVLLESFWSAHVIDRIHHVEEFHGFIPEAQLSQRDDGP